ncbi:sortase domain-bontaining protein [Rhodococcus sp. ARC_M6]|uniref:sortase domain-containing protein n=1 Tax=Rhodococcus sp. ARC_M6 TaxID=2928852 RepID=UPI001FB295DF|nr:sortase [Rhodococcus sp. ARC_M6]MCJ0906366.1 sortase [Rhodococcus sp. ARC_M6]
MAVAALAILVPGCSGVGAGLLPDRSPVESHIAAPPASTTVEPAEPDHIELRSPDGVTYLSSPLHPEKLMRGGESGQQLNPVDELPVWWGESGMPGTSATQTVVVVGHNYSTRVAPFRALGVVEPGDRVVLSTSAGVLEYSVETAGPLHKGTLLGVHELRDSVAGRLILANCDVRDGEPTDDNYIVVAQLVGS